MVYLFHQSHTLKVYFSRTIQISLIQPYLVLRYTGSAYATVFPPSGSYSGSIIDPYYQYAYLDFYPNYARSKSIKC
jgi:hypothetical protein